MPPSPRLHPLLLLLALAFPVLAGQAAPAPPPATAPAAPRIQWLPDTLVLVQEHAGYARMIRLPDRGILCAYERGGRVEVRRSADEGRTFAEPVAAARSAHGAAANPELLLLQDGRVLLTWNQRPKDKVHPFAILTAFSRDGGTTWGESAPVYTADTLWDNGCWEPAALQLPSGEIHLYFANENPYRRTDEQEITLLRSRDAGKTFAAPQAVSFRAGHRDGMPVPLLLQNGSGIALAIEDNGLSGAFKPAIVFTPLPANPSHAPVDGRSPHRWSALQTPLPASVYAGAPYLRQMPTGETVLSVQSTEGGRAKPQMVVYVGDAQARNFAGRSVPFPLPPDVAGQWNALFVKDRDTVTALSGTTWRGRSGVWAIDGRLIRPAATRPQAP